MNQPPTLSHPWQRIADARISRRRMLAAAAATGGAGAAMALVGCGGSSGDDRRGGVLRIGTSLPIGSGLDPQVETGSGLGAVTHTYGYLLHVDPRDDSTILDHAASVEQPDDVTYVIRLRDGLRFHDVAPANGRAVTAEDVVQSIVRFRDNPLVVNKTWHASVLASAEAVDDSTIRIVTNQPYVYTLSALGDVFAGAILPKEIPATSADISGGGAGSGPFAFGDVALPNRVGIRRFDGYHGEKAYLDGVEWQVIGDDIDAPGLLQAKGLDTLICRDKRESDAAAAEGIAITREPSLSWLSIGMRSDRPPFGDERVRRAVDLAIDRGALIEQVAFGDGETVGPVNQHLADGYWSLTQREIGEAQGAPLTREARTAEARRLIEAAGALDAPFSLQVADEPQLVDVASAVAADLRRAGLFPILQRLPLLAWFVNFRSGNFGMALVSHLPYDSPDTPLRFFHSGGVDARGNTLGFTDASIDAVVERSWREPDREAHRDLVLAAQRLMLDARPMIQLFTGAGYVASWDYVRDTAPELPPSLAQYHHRAWLDLPVPRRPA